jgi:hypothetical protein
MTFNALTSGKFYIFAKVRVAGSNPVVRSLGWRHN